MVDHVPDGLVSGQLGDFPPPADCPLVDGVAGGSGSGTTTVVTAIVDGVGADRVAVLPHHAYYQDLSNLPMDQRCVSNTVAIAMLVRALGTRLQA